VKNGLSVRFHADQPSRVTIDIYSPTGRFVSRAFDRYVSAGDYSMFLPVNLRSGIYIVKARIGRTSRFEKIAVVR